MLKYLFITSSYLEVKSEITVLQSNYIDEHNNKQQAAEERPMKVLYMSYIPYQ